MVKYLVCSILLFNITFAQQIFSYENAFSKVTVQTTEQKNIFLEKITNKLNYTTWDDGIMVSGNKLIYFSEEGDTIFTVSPETLKDNKELANEYTAIMKYYGK